MEKSKSSLSWNVWRKWDKSQKVRIIILTVLALIVLLVLAPIVIYYNIGADEPQAISSTASNPLNTTTMMPVNSLSYVLNSKIGKSEQLGASVFKRESGIPMLQKEDPKSPLQSTRTVFVQRLSGTQMSQPFTVAQGYNYAKIWVKNEGKQRIAISISKDSPTGALVMDRVVSIAGETSWSLYTTTLWEPGTYYVNLTSNGSPIKGVTEGRVGARLAELNS